MFIFQINIKYSLDEINFSIMLKYNQVIIYIYIFMSYIGIGDNFLTKEHYIKNYEIILKRENSLEEYLNFIDDCYTQYLKFITNSFKQQKSQELRQKNTIFYRFRSILDSFMNLFKQMIIYQQKQILKLKKQRTSSEIINIFHNLIHELQLLQPMQDSYQKNIQRIYVKGTKLKQAIKKMKELQNQPINWYSINYRKNCYKILLDELKALQNGQKEIDDKTSEITNRRENFYNQIQNFRRIATFHNQDILNRFKIIYKKKVKSFLVIFYVLKQNIKNDQSQFNKRLSKNQDSINLSNSRYQKSKIVLSKTNKDQIFQFQKNSETFMTEITKVTDLYNKNIAVIIRYLQTFNTNLRILNKQFKNILQKYKNILLYNINTKFQLKFSPSQYLRESILCYEISTFKFLELENLIYPIINDLKQISQNLKKHSEISISLLKTSNLSFNNKSQRTNLENNKQINYHTEQFESMIKSKTLKNIFTKFLNILENKLKQIVEWSQQKYQKKKKKNIYLQDSLYMTVYDDTNQSFTSQKQGGQGERVDQNQFQWLYQEDKKISSTHKLNIEQLSKQIQQFKINDNEEDLKQIEHFDASLSLNLSLKLGKLQLNQKYIKFNTQKKEIQLKIPLADIQSINIKSKVFNFKVLQIETKKGIITFQKINDIEKCKKLFLEQIQQKQKIIQKVMEKRKKISIDQSELAIIQVRKQNISKNIINLNSLQIQLEKFVLTDVLIQDIYNELYSDEQKIIDGKKYESFFVYCQSKLNNLKIVSTKYNPKGPKFYTQHYQINFTNCQLYSERILEYDHILPKLPIPFMPKTCHVKQIHRLYWISNEQFHLYCLSYTSGAPYASSLFTKILHKIKKSENNVEIQLKAGIQFLEEPLVKSILKQKSQEQIKIGAQNLIKLLKQRTNQLKNRNKQNLDNEQQIEIQKQEQKISQSISKQNKQNNSDIIKQLEEIKNLKKNMIIVSILLAIFSVLLRLF